MLGPEPEEASHQTARKEKRLAEPFVAMHTDVNFTPTERATVKEGFMDKTITFREVNKLVPKLGRPLWNDSMYTSEHSVILPIDVSQKLVSPARWSWPEGVVSSDADLKPDSRYFQNVMALVSRRVPLERSLLHFRSPWLNFLREQVTRHLRYLCYYYPDSDILTATVPNEPAASIASTWLFRHGSLRRMWEKWSTAVIMMATAHSSIGLDFGSQGEEGVYIIAAIASDDAAWRRYIAHLTRTNPAYEGVMGVINLGDWLKSFIGRPTKADPDKYARLLQWASKQWINFKQVASLPSDVHIGSNIDLSHLLEYWIRHSAFRGRQTHGGWDLMIPTYEHDSKSPPIFDDPLDMDKLSYVTLQVKNCMTTPFHQKSSDRHWRPQRNDLK